MHICSAPYVEFASCQAINFISVGIVRIYTIINQTTLYFFYSLMKWGRMFTIHEIHSIHADIINHIPYGKLHQTVAHNLKTL